MNFRTIHDTEREVDSVDEMPLCQACGLMSGWLVSPENPICQECFEWLNWSYAQGPFRYLTSSHETSHDTPLCPAVQNASEWYLTQRISEYLCDETAAQNGNPLPVSITVEVGSSNASKEES